MKRGMGFSLSRGAEPPLAKFGHPSGMKTGWAYRFPRGAEPPLAKIGHPSGMKKQLL